MDALRRHSQAFDVVAFKVCVGHVGVRETDRATNRRSVKCPAIVGMERAKKHRSCTPRAGSGNSELHVQERESSRADHIRRFARRVTQHARCERPVIDRAEGAIARETKAESKRLRTIQSGREARISAVATNTHAPQQFLAGVHCWLARLTERRRVVSSGSNYAHVVTTRHKPFWKTRGQLSQNLRPPAGSRG